MKNRFTQLLVITFLVTLASGCAGGLIHGGLMKGQVMKVNPDNTLVVCVGTNDGAEVGQKLEAYRFIELHAVAEDMDQFKKEDVGEILIQKIVNEHYAIAKITSGNIQEYDMVQLSNQ